MRNRIMIAMLALIFAVLPVISYLSAKNGFDMALRHEREAALREEAALAAAISAAIDPADQQSIYSAAETANSKYGSPRVSIALLRNGYPLGGGELPDAPQMQALIATRSRATLLASGLKTLFVAHRLSDALVLLFSFDVSDIYEMRAHMARRTAAICAGGMIAAAALAWLLSRQAVRPLRRLMESMRGAAGGDYRHIETQGGGRELRQLTRAYNAMSDEIAAREGELKAQAEQRQNLLDSLAHEMRTPLTSMLGAARLAKRGDVDQAQRAELLDIIARECTRLSHLDQSLMSIAVLRGGEGDFETFSFDEMAAEAASVFSGVKIEGECGTVLGDRELYILLLRNLIDNALKSGTALPVIVRLDRSGFCVIDRGRGMTDEEAVQAFEPFYMADKSRSRRSGGAGLGLALCREIAKVHGGGLRIVSAPGAGTEVIYNFDTTR